MIFTAKSDKNMINENVFMCTIQCNVTSEMAKKICESEQ